jgi:peptidyl-prolyl cis-trans isomerase C/foldase protein PrsA
MRLGVLTLLLLTACPEQARPQQDATVIVSIGTDVVTRVDFERELSRELQALEGSPQRTPEQIEPYKQTLLETMIERTLLLQAAREAGVVVSPDEVDRRVLALASEYPSESFDAALAQSQTTRTELTRTTRTQLTIEKLFAQQVYARMAITEDAIRREYEEQAAEFQEPESVHAQQIVVKGLDEAKRLQQQLAAGKKFSELARRYSLSPDAKVGGDLGFVQRGVMPSQFEDVLFRLGVGQVSDVVSTDYGFHLFKVLEKKPPRKKDLIEVRGQIEQRLLGKLKEAGQREFLKALRAKTEVKINDQVLLTVTGRMTSVRQMEP